MATEARGEKRSGAYRERVVTRVSGLLLTAPKDEREAFRLPGKTGNRVYRVPLDGDGEFFIVKLLPGWRVELHRFRKLLARNIVYGERCVDYLGKKRAAAEVARYREWQAAGLPVPALIEVPLPDVRVIEGLPYPTLRDFLGDAGTPIAAKLDALGTAVEALAHQHRLALERGDAGLVHPESSPRNILFDPEARKVWWFDLEHPREYDHMSVEDVAVRGLRFFVYGILDWLPGHVEEVVALLVQRYEHPQLLKRLADNVERGLGSLPMRLAHRLGYARDRARLQRDVVRLMRESLPAAGR